MVETATVLAGPLVGQFLAELGAEVIKVEPPCGDVTRHWRLADEDGEGPSAYFTAANWGKRSVVLDLSAADGRDALLRMLASADVWLDNFRPGAAQRLGLDPDAILATNPRLVHARLSAYGDDDPRPGYDALLQAETGFMALNRAPGAAPMKFPVALVDILAAHQLKQAVLLALWQRERDGRGRRVHVSLHDAGLSAWANQAAAWLAAGIKPRASGSEHPSIVPYGSVYACGDGQALVLAVGNDPQFEQLCAVIGRAELAADARFADNPARVRNRDLLRDELSRAMAARRRAEWLDRFEAADVPAAGVHELHDALDAPESAHLVLDSEGLRGLRTAVMQGFGPPARLAPPPSLGAHTEAVLAAHSVR